MDNASSFPTLKALLTRDALNGTGPTLFVKNVPTTGFQSTESVLLSLTNAELTTPMVLAQLATEVMLLITDSAFLLPPCLLPLLCWAAKYGTGILRFARNAPNIGISMLMASVYLFLTYAPPTTLPTDNV